MPKIETPAGPVSVVLDGPQDGRPTFVLGHGAGGDMHSEFMTFFARSLGATGARVFRFNFAYSEAGRKAPDRQPLLEETFRAAVDSIGSTTGPLVLGGKSMGGRIASHVVASGTEADALVFLGYPLHPPGKPERIRDEHLRDIGIPMLFVEGTRDPFCPLETLEKARSRFGGASEVAVIDDGDHSFKVRKSSGRSTAEAWEEAVAAVVSWAGDLKG